jgi:urea transport system substrate-binding protein
LTNTNSNDHPQNPTRRDVLKRAGQTSLVLAAAQALSPFVLTGCSKKGADSDTVKVGILHSLTGTMAISEVSLKDVELMAIDEINAKGGILGKKVEAVVEDPESKFTDVFPEKAKKLLLKDKCAAVFGCWTSVSRKNVLPVFEENNGLLFYPVQYEGNECSKNVVYSGACPNQQSTPAIEWLLSKEGGEKKRFYLEASDYVYPRTANYVIKSYLKSIGKGDYIVGENYTALGHSEYANSVQKIKEAKPDCIINTINGDSNTSFFKELAAQGGKDYTAEKCPVMSFSVAEDELKTLPVETLEGHLAAWNYFMSIKTPANEKFVKDFKKFEVEKMKKDAAMAVTDDAIEAAYMNVYFWKMACEKAKSFDVDKVREAWKGGLDFDAPGGKVKLDPQNQHVYRPFMIGKIKKDKQFEIIYKSEGLVKPDPYPQFAFKGWSCDWTKDGIKKGEPVKIT